MFPVSVFGPSPAVLSQRGDEVNDRMASVGAAWAATAGRRGREWISVVLRKRSDRRTAGRDFMMMGGLGVIVHFFYVCFTFIVVVVVGLGSPRSRQTFPKMRQMETVGPGGIVDSHSKPSQIGDRRREGLVGGGKGVTRIKFATDYTTHILHATYRTSPHHLRLKVQSTP